MLEHFYAFPSHCLDNASAAVTLSTAAARAAEKGGAQCIVVIGADVQILTYAQASGDDGPSTERMIDRARQAAVFSIQADGIGSQHELELAAFLHATGV